MKCGNLVEGLKTLNRDNKILKTLRDNIQFIPPLQIILTFLVYTYPKTDWVIVGNLFGYSIFTSLCYVVFFCLFSLSKRYCFLTKLSSVSLLIISIFNSISYNFVNYDIYEPLFSKTISALTILITFLYFIFKCIHKLRTS